MADFTDRVELDAGLLAILTDYFHAAGLPWPSAHAEDALRAGVCDVDAFVWRETEGIRRLAALVEEARGAPRARALYDLQTAVHRLAVLLGDGA